MVGVLGSLLLLFQCSDEEGNSGQFQVPPTNIDEEVFQLVQSIRFVGTLPNGMELNFAVGSQFSEPGATRYTDLQDLNFTDASEGIFIDASEFSGGGGILTVGDTEYPFQFSWCITFGELRRRYPQHVNLDPLSDDNILFIALGRDNYSPEEILDGEPFRVDDYLSGFINPNLPEPRISSTSFLSADGLLLDLIGTYSLEDGHILSAGSAILPVSGIFFESYSFALTCSD